MLYNMLNKSGNPATSYPAIQQLVRSSQFPLLVSRICIFPLLHRGAVHISRSCNIKALAAVTVEENIFAGLPYNRDGNPLLVSSIPTIPDDGVARILC